VWRSLGPFVCVAALAAGGVAAYLPPPPGEGGRTYVVARGDNLTVIARRFGTSVGALATANRLDPQRVLREGTRLSLPPAPTDRSALVPVFQRWAAANRLPVDLLMATTWLESGWQNTVVSPTGAVGIGQLMPATAAFIREDLIGVPSLDVRVPEHNIRMSARYLRWLLDRNGGDQVRAIASYYQGPRSVEERGLYASTFAYVRGVQALQRVFGAGRFPKPT
jgi:soluble lytic murein transglycosylase-like protein